MTATPKPLNGVTERPLRTGPVTINDQRRDIQYPYVDVFCGDLRVAVVASPTTNASAETIKARARRFVACWNACNGIPSPALEAGAVAETRESLEEMGESLELLAAKNQIPTESSSPKADAYSCGATESLRHARAVLAKYQPKGG